MRYLRGHFVPCKPISLCSRRNSLLSSAEYSLPNSGQTLAFVVKYKYNIYVCFSSILLATKWPTLYDEGVHIFHILLPVEANDGNLNIAILYLLEPKMFAAIHLKKTNLRGEINRNSYISSLLEELVFLHDVAGFGVYVSCSHIHFFGRDNQALNWFAIKLENDLA